MVYGVGNCCLKALMFITNLLIFLAGAAIFGVSLWGSVDNNFINTLRKFAQDLKVPENFIEYIAQYRASLWIFVGIGAVLLVVGFLGCCGVGCENIFMLTLFFVVVLVLSIVQIYALVYMYSGRDQFDQALHDTLAQSAKTHETRMQLKPIQDLIKCCGATSETAAAYKQENICTAEEERMPDCYTVLKGIIENDSQLILIAAIVLLVVEAFSMIFACVLCRAFKERQNYTIYA